MFAIIVLNKAKTDENKELLNSISGILMWRMMGRH